jgi:hypothetical protein
LRRGNAIGAILGLANVLVLTRCADRVAALRFADSAPDLIVDTTWLARSWVVHDEDLTKDDRCSLVEGGVTPGVHRVLRFTVSTPNIGSADVFIGNPLEHVAANDGFFEFATCHSHFHFRHYALYELVDPASGKVWRAAKKGFCMVDTDAVADRRGPWAYRICGTRTTPGYQGISVGWADTYNKHLGGQYFVLDGGDGQDTVPPGQYLIRITVNPPFTPNLTDPCPVTGPDGFCHMLKERRYDNNVGEVRITIPVRSAAPVVGPGSLDPPDQLRIDADPHCSPHPGGVLCGV